MIKTTLGYHCEQCGLNFKIDDLFKNKFCPRCGSDCVLKTYVFLDIDGEVWNDD